MRMDYALYGLAIVLFALTLITLVMVDDSEGKVAYAASTAVVGLLAVGAGYFLKPKNTVATTAQTASPEPVKPQATVTEPNQKTGGPIVEAQTTQIQVSEAPKIETLAVQAPIVATPQLEVPIVTPQREEAPLEVAATHQTASEWKKSEFGQIRSISQKRAEQLNSLGVHNMKDLANASATDLAEKLNVSIKIVKMWIGSAKKLSK